MKSIRIITLVLWGWCGFLFAQPEGTPEDWLQRMASALRGLNYQISFVVLQPNGEFEPYLWRHALVDDIEMEHLSLQNGPGREIVRVDDLVSYFEPNVPAFSLRSDVINGPLPAELFRNPHALEHAYDYVMIGRSRISGRSAQQIRIVSKDKSRYGFNLWLDQESGLLLKLDMTDVQGEVLEQVQVTSLQVTAEPDEYFSRIEKSKLPELVEMSDTGPLPIRWQIGWLPEGMQILRRDIHRLPMTGQMVEYAMLSDGLVDVSVYLQAVDPGTSENGWLRYGANTLLSLQQGALEVTVVGKVPPQTASTIANSITLVKGND
ncbi:MucB/RseB C-terminal domain-containing protein [Aliiglaciecola sp. CAU 1673]|uniref:MucB/RseB C-terminal domain-containing protein n=1 Tax=Aliiglaciecola sp. CAU 1673 TaxID=3032595 RepID=UPI0023DC835E|nr:MucB/RseB C-terminal domain-containing protein [Aliiglaciecola sp. CAU 1673]MDF2177996.1 MucB/RseB C-terminal domain-containing protein [Aliiglaciecola sp. CAU 1673]